jgi:hypothetical protein
VLWPAQSIYDGTWGSGPGPVEVQWVELMREFGWSWRDLEEMPPYVRRVCWDLLLARREAEAAAQRRPPQPGGG